MYWNHSASKNGAQESIISAMYWNHLGKKPSQPTWSSTCIASASPTANQKLKKESPFVRRPQTAVHGHHIPPAGSSNMSAPPGRPSTAPALLRGEGLIVKSSHKDPFLEKVENKEVRRCCEAMRQEQLMVKAVIRACSAPGDTSLYDLQKLHSNSATRARHHKLRGKDHGELPTPSPSHGSGVSSPRSAATAHRFSTKDTAAADSMRALASTLQGNLRHHLKRLGVPPMMNPPLPGKKVLVDKNNHRCSRKRYGITGADHDLEDDRKSLKKQPQFLQSLEFRHDISEIFRTRAQDKTTPRDFRKTEERSSFRKSVFHTRSSVSDASLQIFQRCLEEKYGNLRAAFKVFDSSGSGSLTLGDWDRLVKESGCPDDSMKQLRPVLPDGDAITLEDFEDLFTSAEEQDAETRTLRDDERRRATHASDSTARKIMSRAFERSKSRSFAFLRPENL